MEQSHHDEVAHVKLLSWVEERRKLCAPAQVQWCNGSAAEFEALTNQLVANGTFIRLNEKTRPGSFLARTDPRDVEPVNDKTFVCASNASLVGATNQWAEPKEMRERLGALFAGCMEGRTMYVAPYCMGPVNSKYRQIGVMVTDSPYIVALLHQNYVVGTKVVKDMDINESFLPTLHSVGVPLHFGQRDSSWPCSPDNVTIALFPDDDIPNISAFGTVFGFMNDRVASLRLASMLLRKNPQFIPLSSSIISIQSPEGNQKYLCFAMPEGTIRGGGPFEISTLPGWTSRCVSAEVTWLNVGNDGRLYGINPFTGFSGRAVGVSDYTHRSLMDSFQQNTIFTNCAITKERDVWWEGMTKEPPKDLLDWTGQKWIPGQSDRLAAHPKATYAVSMNNCPVLDPEWNNPEGVPIAAVVFGMRHEVAYPLIYEAFNWVHGIFWASLLPVGEYTENRVRVPARRSPLGMGRTLGVNVLDYIDQWKNIRKYLGYSSPKLFFMNLFRVENGQQLWRGYEENFRIFKWIFQRIDGRREAAGARKTAIGYVPTIRSFDFSGLSMPIDHKQALFSIDSEAIAQEVVDIRKYLATLGDHALLKEQIDSLEHLNKIDESHPPTENKDLIDWVDRVRKLCKPLGVRWCDGSKDEYDEMCSLLVKNGTFTALNPVLRPNSYVARSDPRDVARVESKTFICSQDKEDAGPTNNWMDPDEAREKLNGLFDGCMKGRTMYVIPFCMGPLGSPYSKYGVEITDSPYVVVNMRIMTRMGSRALIYMKNAPYLPCLHSVGVPLEANQKDVTWPCNPEKTIIAHFPQDPCVMSFGSGYGGNALLGKKCYALRIASNMGKKEGWLAEHMLILSLTSPDNSKYYIAAAFPSACGKTNLAMLVPTLPGWVVRCVGDDIAWMHVTPDGSLNAINPENGFFGVAPGTSDSSNPSMMRTIKSNTIYTNVAMTPEGDVWWEGMTKVPPPELIDWTGQKWTPGCGRLSSHPNSRFTAPANQCPVIDPEWMNPNGVPISAILFGGRRNTLVPLVVEAFSWQQGIFLGSGISSETTSAAEGNAGVVRRDPFAMLPFCGYNMGDYWNHWLEIRKALGYNSPKIFYVNWFRKNKEGKYIWPGFGENSRVLKWVCCRIGRNPSAKAIKTPIGLVPAMNELDISGLDLEDDVLKSLTEVECSEWETECKAIREFYSKFGDRVPKKLLAELDELEKRLVVGTDHQPPTSNKKIIDWVEHVRSLCKPARVHWVNGSNEENEELCALLVKQGTFTPLPARPGSYLARSNPKDVARVESKTFICTTDKEDAGSTNNWCDPTEMKKRLDKLFDGCMQGRTMYIIPFSMGPVGSPYSKFGIEVTDSAYVVVNMRIMTRMGLKILNLIDENKFFLPCLHSVGVPLPPKNNHNNHNGDHPIPIEDSWPCNPDNTVIAHFPEELTVMSFGSGYGGNALLGKKCYSLRIASVMGKKEGWLAEHMLILGMTSPQGKKYYIVAAFPSACGKTNLAMLVPSLPGWIVRCVGDDIAWLHVGDDGRLYAINPENGFFGVAPGTSAHSNPSAMASITKNTIFTNVALTPEGDVWWEGMTKVPPPELIDWTGQKWTPGCGRVAAHPNSRYTAPAYQCPVIDPEWENSEGVPICAILFGGRRERVVPLVIEAPIWEQGVFMGSIISSEQTAAAEGKLGQVRRDPYAMLPFCGYNMADYFSHWLEFRKKLGFLSPKIFYVNWFRKENGKFLWPGFGENCRVLKWVCERVDGVGKARSTPIGLVPTHDALDLDGLDIEQDVIHKLLSVDSKQWMEELPGIKQHYANFGARLPHGLLSCLNDLEKRLEMENKAPTCNVRLVQWVESMQELLGPTDVKWVKGTTEEYDDLCDSMVANGSLIRLNNDLRPNSFVVRTDPRDTASLQENTFLCSENPDAAGPLNNWAEPKQMRKEMLELFKGAMKGRTMYVLVYCMGPIGSIYSRFGAQITDSPHVVMSTLLQTRTGIDVLNILKNSDEFFSCVHSVGCPLDGTKPDVAWPCNVEHQRVAYFANETDGYNVMSYGSAWGSNAVACRIPHGIRSASMRTLQSDANWSAESCAILGITSPEGKKIYVAAFLPKGCGKTALSMIIPTIPGWTIRCVGEDIAWLHVAEDGKLWAINPMKGIYDVATGTSENSNRAMVHTCASDTLFTNVGVTEDGDVWWEGKTEHPPKEKVFDWQGREWTKDSGRECADRNSRFAVKADSCPVIDQEWENPNGVPIAALIFGGKRKSTFPLVVEAANWEQGMFLASTMGKDVTNHNGLSSSGHAGDVKRLPFAAAPFLGCNINTYMKQWLDVRAISGYNIPKIFVVNWFRESANGETLWPGFRENCRILKWIHRRTTDFTSQLKVKTGVTKTPIGLIPEVESLDLRGCEVAHQNVKESLAFSKKEWTKELAAIGAFYDRLGEGLPAELRVQLDNVQKELEFF